jgi:hypothetical protein
MYRINKKNGGSKMAEKMEFVPGKGVELIELEEKLMEMFCAMGLRSNITVRSCPEAGSVVVSNLASWGGMLELLSEVMGMTGAAYFVKTEKASMEKAVPVGAEGA